MANSMHIPLSKMPENINELKIILSQAFDLFCISIPEIRFYKPAKENDNLFNKFVIIEGDNIDRQCWISFGEYTTDITEKEGYNFMASVTTRCSWDFAGIVAYSLCQFSGYVVFNDSGELDGQNEYTPESLYSTLISRL